MGKKANRFSLAASQLNFRPPVEVRRGETKGNKPLPEPIPIGQVLLLMVVHLCRKVLFVDPSIKVGIYIIVVFIGSILGDVIPFPGTYFSRKDNLFNVYFVKLGWGWTMSLVGAFVYLTSSVYCVGDVIRIRKQLLRLLVATLFWFFWTKSFVYVEEAYGYCSKAIVRAGSRQCLAKGFTWHSFSISGHAFILIYCTLIIMEEAKALVGWEAINDHLRNEEHNRSSVESGPITPLDSLSPEQLLLLREKYDKFTPYIRIIFIGMTTLVLIWDVMLVATIIYFHSTPEKFIASVISVSVWFFTYRFVYQRRLLGIPLPGEGIIRYMNPNQPLVPSQLRRSSLLYSHSSKSDNKVPTFMGMPLNPMRNMVAPETGGAPEERVLRREL